ncbi:MAG TPA: NAD(P)-dependent oxidoreductase [Oligoflexia bacterium]|nr:NAD(P)-dependent oxidoreductase [Oligoflexia bacterium]HMP47970.1 NAD(P)-dependent oxidoreductase [Oligoflexia bacterium]
MKNLKFAIVNSSSYGKHFPEHIDRLKRLGEVLIVNVPQDIKSLELASKLQGIHGIVASVTPRFDSICLSACNDLILLARHGIGCDNVDLASATELGIMVSRVKGEVEQESVAEMAVGLALSGSRFMHAGYEAVKSSRWKDRANFLGPELGGKIIGILGLGNIGSRVAEIMSLGFKSEVIACDPYLSENEIIKRHARKVTFDQLIETADLISFHCPLTKETGRIFSSNVFSRLKHGVVLVNTCRGELLDEDALIDALACGRVRSYATDVVEGEPIDGNHRLLEFPNVLITPHLGGYSDESLYGMGQTMVDDIEAVFRNGEKPGLLANPDVYNSSKLRTFKF